MNPNQTAGSTTFDRRFFFLIVGSLGVVYGDIGTSPLYAMRECFSESHNLPVDPQNVLGVLSLIVWSLILIISLKYLLLVMRADNNGEGGVFALMTLAVSKISGKERQRMFLQVLGILGAALLYGDGMITPAITVLGAVEGLSVVAPVLDSFIVPIAVGILLALFMFQSRGTERIGWVFGPVMIVWFVCIAAMGIPWIIRRPEIFAALNPYYGVNFFLNNGWNSFLALGSVFLVVTGGEAVYADMGHFGKRPIRFSWFTLVFPALLLNYFGQGCLLLETPASAGNPFYRLAPLWAVYPLVVIASMAAVVASQAVISGAFSLTRQALQLGYCPTMEIRHVSPEQIGQIYVPAVNWFLMISTIGLVLGFRSSGNLAAAYGIAVSTTMVITVILAYFCTRAVWGWNPFTSIIVLAPFLVLDGAFFLSNSMKLHHGGWFAFFVGVVVFMLLTTWKKGQAMLERQKREESLSIKQFLESIKLNPPKRVPGTAVYLTSDPESVPRSLLHNLKHNRTLHERLAFLTVITTEAPRVTSDKRLRQEVIQESFFRIVAFYGFMESPDIPKLLRHVSLPGFDYKPMETTFFNSQRTLIPTKRRGMATWRKHLFGVLDRNAQRVILHYNIPPNRVVELGAQIEF